MAGLEAVLRIGAQDDSAKAFSDLKRHIDAIDKQVSVMSKLVDQVSKVTSTTDPMVKSIGEAQRALNLQREAIIGVTSGLDQMERAGGAAGSAQARLAREVELATRAMVAQGTEAYRVGEKINAVRKRAGGGHGGGGGGFGEMLPFEGPAIIEGTKKAAEAGMSVQEQVARISAAGGTPEQIAKAKADFLEFSKTHAGVLESDYLGAFKEALTIAPTEPHEMALLGSRYLAAARNSGVSASDSDVGNVLRIMDELGLKDMGDRESFLDHTLKAQQQFGNQIPTETMLAAYRNAKQSIYGWSPEFRNKVFPTLLQSSGQQGGTEMMTGLMNYVGGHMQVSELKALIKAGFVDSKDLTFDHNHPVVRDGAKLFEADVMKSNIFQWATDFHKHFMARKGATEDQFDNLLYKMPRNMSAMISFFTHNEDRINRDVSGHDKAVGTAAESNNYLAANPIAGLEALGKSIEQFAAAVTGPSMDKVGAGLAATAQGVQSLSAAVGDFAAKNPKLASDFGLGAMGAGAGIGGWLTWKLMSGVASFFGGGGSAAGGGAAGGAGGGFLGGVISRLGALGAVVALTEWLDPKGNFGGLTSGVDDWVKNNLGFDPSNVSIPRQLSGETHTHMRARIAREKADAERLAKYRNVDLNPLGLDPNEYGQMRFGLDREARRANAMSTLMDHGPSGDFKVSLDPNSRATVTIDVRVSATEALLQAIASAQASAEGSISARLGRMDSDAAPIGHGGIGRR